MYTSILCVSNTIDKIRKIAFLSISLHLSIKYVRTHKITIPIGNPNTPKLHIVISNKEGVVPAGN